MGPLSRSNHINQGGRVHGQPPRCPSPVLHFPGRCDEWPCFRPAQSMHHHQICEFKCKRTIWRNESTFFCPDGRFLGLFFPVSRNSRRNRVACKLLGSNRLRPVEGPLTVDASYSLFFSFLKSLKEFSPVQLGAAPSAGFYRTPCFPPDLFYQQNKWVGVTD